MAKDRKSKQALLNIENQIKRRFQEMEETLIKIQQENSTTKLWQLKPTDWNARNTTPIKIAAFFTPEIFKEDEHEEHSQQAITNNSKITTYFNWKPSHVFHTQCVIKNTVCSLVIYGGNNIVSKRLVQKMKLRTANKDPSVRVMLSIREEEKVAEETCRVPVSIGEYYKKKVTCYVVNMEEEDDNQILFGGPWLYNVCARHDAQDNTCTIIWNQNMIVLQSEFQDNES